MEVELSCPMNKVGEVTLYQTSRHGAWDDAGSPTHLYAIKPQVIVVNNGPRKGLGGTSPVSARSRRRITTGWQKSPGIEGIWQGHRSLLDPDPAHNTAEDMIANLERARRAAATGFGRRSARTARSPSRTAATGSAEPTRRAELGACAGKWQ